MVGTKPIVYPVRACRRSNQSAIVVQTWVKNNSPRRLGTCLFSPLHRSMRLRPERCERRPRKGEQTLGENPRSCPGDLEAPESAHHIPLRRQCPSSECEVLW